MTVRALLAVVFLVLPITSYADCGLKYQACEKICKVKHLADDAAYSGCVSRCVAERGVCLAKLGAEKTVEAGEKVVDSTKSFIKGLSGE